jgi:HlyD family secretion protein
MSETLTEYDELLDITDHHWRNRLIGLAALAALLAVGAYALWAVALGGGGSTAAETQTATVQRGSISQTVSTTGVAVAQSTADLSFDQSGTVSAVNVTLGREVKQGDVLAEIKADDLQSAVVTAQVNLDSAQAQLNELLAGSTAADLASADQSLLQAQANLRDAQNSLQDLLDGASDTELRAAEQAVAAAETQLSKAQESRDNLYTNSEDAIAAAQDALDRAEDSLLTSKLSLLNAADTYCDTEDHILSICVDFTIPLTDAEMRQLANSIADEISSADPAGDEVQIAEAEPSPTATATTEPTPQPTPQPTAEPESTETPEAEATATATPATQNSTSNQTQTGSNIIQATNSLISANISYKNAVANLEAAQKDLQEAKKGPSSTDVAAADVEVEAAQLALDEAKANLEELKAGPTQDYNDAVQSNVDAATAALAVAQAKRDDVYAGAGALDIELQREQVRQAELAVEDAQENLKGAQLIAPFDGTVAELNIQVGDEVGGGGTNAAITLSTPDAIYLSLTITESDVTSVKAGQSGIATFDALEGQAFPIEIESVGTNPTTTQGVVTYQAEALVLTPTAGPAGASSSGTSDVADTSAKPLPGMNASVTITVDQAHDVLIVPESAIQTEGRNSVVEVQNADGSTEKVVVQTGLSDGSNVEITQGLEEGQTVMIPTRSTTTSTVATQTAGTQQGVMPEGGMPPGGPTGGSAP